MIHHINGLVHSISENLVIIDVQGIGYGVAVANPHIYSINSQASLSIYAHWSAENGPQLFGFANQLEKTIFGLIINCSGIGPKLGLAILADFSPSRFVMAITTGDVKALSSVSGVGAKKAESMILQLRDKVTKIDNFEFAQSDAQQLVYLKQVSDVLDSLSYSRQEIQGALEYVKKNCIIDSAPFDELMRKSLSFLSKK